MEKIKRYANLLKKISRDISVLNIQGINALIKISFPIGIRNISFWRPYKNGKWKVESESDTNIKHNCYHKTTKYNMNPECICSQILHPKLYDYEEKKPTFIKRV